MLFLLSAAAVAATLVTPMFNVSEIAVSGNTNLDAQELKLASGIILGRNIFRVSTKKAERNMEKMPYVKAVSVSRRLPDTIKINVTERRPALYIEVLDGVLVLDAGGTLISNISGADKPNGPFITGLEVSEFKIGEKIKVDENEKIDIMLLYAKHLKDSGLDVLSIDIKRPEDVLLTLSGGLAVSMGSAADIEYKIRNLIKIAGELGPGAGGCLDMRNPDKASYRKNP